MILQALAAYYQRLIEEGSNIAPEGFERKEIPFLIVLDQEGNFKGLQDTREVHGKKLIARKFLVPKEKARSGSLSWKTANILWDNYGYVLGVPKSESEKDKNAALKQHSTFVAQIKELNNKYSDDSEVKAVYQFLKEENISRIFSDKNWIECKKIPGCILSFRIANQTKLVCENNENIKAYIMLDKSSLQIDEVDDDDTVIPTEATCLITGEYGPVTRLHTRTPIWNSKSNARIVSFQKNSGFDSYGKEQGYNAPVSQKAEFAYTTALNHLLSRNSTQKIQIGDATTVFWAEKKNEMENVFAEFFGWNTNVNYEQDYKQLLALFHSPEAGIKRPELNPSTKFFVLGLAPNAARISVRFWYAGTVGEIADNIYQHFNDLEIVKGEKDWHKIDLHSLLKSTALQEKEDNVAPNLAGDTMKAILNGTPYPRTLLSSVLTRIKAEQALKDKNGKPIPNVNFTRAAMIKALLVREARYYKQNNKEVTLSLDINNKNTGYLLGRLFAVLEKAQERANPGINATIRDRYYSAASSTPIAAFPSLMKLKNYHIAKLDNKGEAIYFEKMIGEIVSKLGADTSFPAYLNLQDQGRFAVGYYHQRQDFYTKKENSNEKEGE
jgi:CRISPR-associated protein Csd1